MNVCVCVCVCVCIYIYIYIYTYTHKIFFLILKVSILMKQFKYHNVFIYYTKYVFFTNCDLSIPRHRLKNWFKGVFFFSMIVLLEDIMKWDKTNPKVRLVDQKQQQQQEQRTISSESPACVIESWLLQTSQLNWTNFMKKMCQHSWCENSVPLAYIAELLSRNHGRGSKIMSNGWNEPRRTKTSQLISRIVLLTDKSKFKIFWSNRRVYVQLGVGERAAPPPYHTNHKARRRLCYGVRRLLPLEKLGICTKWRANWIRMAITAYCSIMQSHLECGLWVKDCTQAR